MNALRGGRRDEGVIQCDRLRLKLLGGDVSYQGMFKAVVGAFPGPGLGHISYRFVIDRIQHVPELTVFGINKIPKIIVISIRQRR